jgi:hypothetical protein
MTGMHGDVGYTLSCYAQPSSGVWHHLATVYDKSQSGTNAILFYVDGALQTPSRQLYTATNTNYFGANPSYLFSRGGSQQFGSGEIDDLRIYNRALSASEIQQIYASAGVSSGASLQSVAVTPGNSSLPVGGTQQFTAVGTYSDGSIQNLSSGVSWSSSKTSVATINSSGLATGVATGTATIQAVSGSLSGSTGLSVVTGGAKFVQWTSGDNASATSSSTYQDKSATSGNLIIVFSHWDNQASTATVTDQLGNTYVPVFASPANVGTADRFQVWYAKNIKGGVPLGVTVHYSAKTTSLSVVDAAEYSGLQKLSPLDVFVSATGNGAAQNSGNMPATTSGSDLIVGLFGYAGYANPYTAGAGFTFRNYDASTLLEDRAVSVTGVYNATASSSTSVGYAAFAIAFKVGP